MPRLIRSRRARLDYAVRRQEVHADRLAQLVARQDVLVKRLEGTKEVSHAR